MQNPYNLHGSNNIVIAGNNVNVSTAPFILPNALNLPSLSSWPNSNSNHGLPTVSQPILAQPSFFTLMGSNIQTPSHCSTATANIQQTKDTFVIANGNGQILAVLSNPNTTCNPNVYPPPPPSVPMIASNCNTVNPLAMNNYQGNTMNVMPLTQAHASNSSLCHQIQHTCMVHNNHGNVHVSGNNMTMSNNHRAHAHNTDRHQNTSQQQASDGCVNGVAVAADRKSDTVHCNRNQTGCTTMPALDFMSVRATDRELPPLLTDATSGNSSNSTISDVFAADSKIKTPRIHNREQKQSAKQEPADDDVDIDSNSNVESNAEPTNPDKPFKCQICRKEYKYLCNYKSHYKIHTNNCYQCEFCGKRFGRKSNYKEHVRVHTGEAPYKCEFCAKTFKQRHGWKDHLRVHTGEKPYECDVCGRCFSVGHNLNVHKRIHTGERPFQCALCEKAYRQKSAYNAHAKNVHGIILSKKRQKQ